MKTIKILALLVCASALFTTGCHSCHKHSGCQKAACSSYKNTCGHPCCIEAKTDCAHCPKCTPAK